MTAAGICTLDGLVGLSGFRCIVADPPWPMKRNSGTLYPGATDTPPMKARPLDYPVMPVADIAALPVRDLAADGCHLYLWTTQAFLRDAYTVLDAWGFKQGALLVWSKPPKGVVGTWVCSAEFCIFARRGTLKHLRRHIGTVFQWSRGRHSAKPEAFQDMVETVSPGPYLELFARRRRLGWVVWGNEISGEDCERQEWRDPATPCGLRGPMDVSATSSPYKANTAMSLKNPRNPLETNKPELADKDGKG